MNSAFGSGEKNYLTDPFMSQEELDEMDAHRERAELLAARREDEHREP